MSSKARAGDVMDPYKLIRSDQASIPWLPKSSDVAPLLQQILSQTKSDECSNSRDLKIDLLKMIDKSFPFYLPASYHSMDINSIHKNSIDGSYWEIAYAFLCLLTGGATVLVHDLGMEPKMSLLVEAGSETCETAAEFLFEPWVLIQLPFQPALLYQWAVAAYAESLIYSKRLVEIGTRGYAPQFNDLYTKLAELSITLSHNCKLLLFDFCFIYCQNLEENTHVRAKRVFIDKSPDMLAETLAILEFVLSEGCVKIFDFIKNNSWAKEFSPLDLIYSDFNSDIRTFSSSPDALHHVWDDRFWQNIIGEARTTFTMKYCVNSKTKICPVAVKEYVKNEILNNGWIVGIDNIEKFFDNLTNQIIPEELTTFNECLAAIWSLKNDKSVPEPEWFAAGVICQILSLHAGLISEHALGTVTRLVWRAAKKFDEGVHFKDEGDPQLQDMNELLEQVNNVKNCKEKWSFESLLRRAEETCTPTQPDETNLILQYTRRIRSIVFKIHKAHINNLQSDKQPFTYHPEVPFIQYILPCVIATYLDVITESQSARSVNFYTNFMEHVVIGYEKSPIHCKLDVRRKHYFHNKETFHQEYDLQIKFLEKKLRNYFKGSRKLNNILLKISKSSKMRKEVPEISRSTQEISDFLIQVWWGLGRFTWHIQQIESNYDFTLQKIILSLGFLEHSYEYLALRILFKNGHKSDGKLKRAVANMCKLFKIPKLKARHLQELSFHQLFSISLYQAWTAWSTKFQTTEDARKFCTTRERPYHAFDILHCVVLLFLNKDFLGVIGTIDRFYKRQREVPLEVAKNNLWCEPLLKSLTPEGKVKMEQPGQCTFFPIQHCRWCGLVHTSELRLCVECKDEPKFDDPHYFCSRECEKDALDKYHLEQHADFVMRLLNIQ